MLERTDGQTPSTTPNEKEIPSKGEGGKKQLAFDLWDECNVKGQNSAIATLKREGVDLSPGTMKVYYHEWKKLKGTNKPRPHRR